MTIPAAYQPLAAFAAGVVLALVLGFAYGAFDQHPADPAGSAGQDEVHVHSDFLVYLDGEQLDFTADKYQSKTGHVLLEGMHLHDGEGTVLHRHAGGITLAKFFDSLGFTLTDRCITTDTEAKYCSNDTEQLMLFVNGTATSSIANYVNQERDQLLLYYGDPDALVIDELLTEVTDEACIYSGTCPERGTPPPESCGITCEL